MRKLTRKTAGVNGRPLDRPLCKESVDAFRAGSSGPDPWLVEHTGCGLARLPELADRHLGTGMGGLGNYNLDTGRDESACRDHETTKYVLQMLGWAA